MFILILVIVFLVLIYAPQFWVSHTLKKYHYERKDFPGTGGQLARHLLDRFSLQHVSVEETNLGDHYDPEQRKVGLSPDNFNKRSLTAVVVAAHEVGHAIQHAGSYRPLLLRGRLAKLAQQAERFGMFVLLGGQLLALVSRSPLIGLLTVLAMFSLFAVSVVVHMVTLPVEFDASFNRALPILERGEYIKPADSRPARRILRAAALTYVASSLVSILNFARWLQILSKRF